MDPEDSFAGVGEVAGAALGEGPGFVFGFEYSAYELSIFLNVDSARTVDDPSVRHDALPFVRSAL
jgi:hypothetical protein